MKQKLAFLFLLALGVAFFTWLLVLAGESLVLDPKGWVGIRQKELFYLVVALMLIVVVPVFWLAVAISWKYRAGNSKARYLPDWDNNFWAELVWWGFPCAIILALSIVGWRSCFELDPFKPLVSEKSPKKIQVVALQWKWLFIYPEEGIAVVNYCQFPEKTPIAFELSGQAPMNSFWIPELGGQIFAMAGMRTKLHLIADQTGSYHGCSANISGKGFAGMTFVAKATSDDEYQAWVERVKGAERTLDLESYRTLAMPSSYEPVTFYQLKGDDLFDQIVRQYDPQ